MSAFPSNPVTPQCFVEEIVPALYVDLALADVARGIPWKLGLVLRGDQGGEWTLAIVDGELVIRPGRSEDCEITIVQRVEDWRSALWEGRPGLVSELVDALLKEGREGILHNRLRVVPQRAPRSLEGLSDIQGLVEAVIAGEPGTPDWRLGIRIGPGPIPETPQATIRLGAEQAEAIRRGDLHPVQALIAGQLRLEGDLGLILQLQAVAMTAMLPEP
jgi:hypothetical protein